MDDRATSSMEKPPWWIENEQIKAELGLPAYEPSRFEDGVYTHEIVEDIQNTFGCEIRFVGVNPIYPDDWAVRIDRAPAFPIGRRRDQNGNTIFEMKSDTFRSHVIDYLE